MDVFLPGSHLVRFSIDTATCGETLSRRSLEALFQLADTDDRSTLENCVVAVSNLCSKADHRPLLLELNVTSKLVTYIPMLR